MKGDCVPDEIVQTTLFPLNPDLEAEEARVKARLNSRTDSLGRIRVDGLKSVGEGVNPKDKIGATKLDPTVIPHSAKVQWILAQMDGVTKYGPYNWRVEPVQIMTYLGAAERHLDAFREGEEVAQDSLVHHLGHVMACCAIIIDAMSQGTAIDNRPINGVGSSLMVHANELIANKAPGWGR